MSSYWSHKRDIGFVPAKQVAGDGAVDALESTRQALKEFVYEDIRGRQFPSRPSRFTCIYLFESPDENSARDAAKGLGIFVGPEIYEVKPVDSANLHVADADLLNYSKLLSSFDRRCPRASIPIAENARCKPPPTTSDF
ncbi:MAG: DUF2441 domain-containing protein [Deltaproteobacteria bacterium]|nr:DUF2441 domain-containing protein [Deltaproteobacteria bacterium]